MLHYPEFKISYCASKCFSCIIRFWSKNGKTAQRKANHTSHFHIHSIFSIHIMYLDCWAQSALNAQWKQDLCLNQNKADEWRKGMHTAGWRSLRQRGNKAVTHICTKFDVLCIMREHSTVHLWINSYNHSLYFYILKIFTVGFYVTSTSWTKQTNSIW